MGAWRQARSMILGGTLLAVAGLALAQPDVANVTGKERKPYKPTLLLAQPLSQAQQTEFLAKLDVIRTVLRATPALRDLKGYDWEVYSSVKTSANAAKAPVVAVLGYIVFPYVVRNGTAEASAEGPGLKIHINDPEQMLPDQLYDVDQEARFARQPKITGEIDGLPVYSDEFVFISKRGEAPFVPISRERYLTHVIGKARKELVDIEAQFKEVPDDPAANKREIESRLEGIRAARAEQEQRWAAMGKWPDRVAHERERFDAREKDRLAEVESLRTTTPRQRFTAKFRERLQSYENELAQLSSEQRAADAYLPGNSGHMQPSGLAAPGATDGARIVTLNPNLFDAAKPRTAIQNIMLGTPRYQPQLYRQVQRQVDKQALLGVID